MPRVLRAGAVIVLTGCFDVGLGEDQAPAPMESPPGPCALGAVEGEAAAPDAVRDHLVCRGQDPAALQVECGPPFEHWLYSYDRDTGTVGEWRVDCEAFVGDQLLAVRTVTVGIARQIEVLPWRGIHPPICPGHRRDECSRQAIQGSDELINPEFDTPEEALAVLEAQSTCAECDMTDVVVDCWGPAQTDGWWIISCRTHYPTGAETYSWFPFDTY